MVYFVALLIFIGVFIIVDWLLEMNPQDTNVGLTAGATAVAVLAGALAAAFYAGAV